MSQISAKPIGLAIVGCGRGGRICGREARAYPGTQWLGLCDVDEKKGRALAEELRADFFTKDYRELLGRPEANAAVLATDENEHAATLFAAIDQGHRILAEKPLATNAGESAKIVRAAERAGVDLVVGYTQRFRRRWLAAREHVRAGQLGEITSATTRAFLNRMVAHARLAANEDRRLLSPMVISGTHALDVVLWILGDGKEPAEIYARSVAKSLRGMGAKDATFALFTFGDGAIWSFSVSWALPVLWPASTYGLEVGIVGTEGVLTIDDTHRDIVLAAEKPLKAHRGDERQVSFLESYPAGDMSDGQFWGPMKEETISWLSRIATGARTPHATAAEGHRNLMLTMACDLSAKRKRPVALPLDPEELHRELIA